MILPESYKDESQYEALSELLISLENWRAKLVVTNPVHWASKVVSFLTTTHMQLNCFEF